MNPKFDQLLTISALTGWVASIAALLTIGVNPHRPFTPLAAQLLPSSASALAATPTHFPLKVARVSLGYPIMLREPPLLAFDAQHWLDRRLLPPNLLNQADPEAVPAASSPWLNHAD